jgi:hypothetical protein
MKERTDERKKERKEYELLDLQPRAGKVGKWQSICLVYTRLRV